MVETMDRRLYPQFENNWDDVAFREHILKHLTASSVVLDLGAGAGIVPQMNFRGLVARMCGVDPDPRVRSNPHLDERVEGVGERIPYPDHTFDVVFADNVLEHLAEPDAVFAEVHRVLKPGGVFLAKTPNRWHYVPLIAQVTPPGFHRWVNAIRGRPPEDTFPTRYRANSPGAVRRLGAATGFVSVQTVLIEGRPEYLRLSAVTYLFGWLYERAVNSMNLLRGLRLVMILEARA